MNYDLELFKKGKTYIKLETQEKYDEVMKWLEENDITWIGGDKATSRNDIWSEYSVDTAIIYKTKGNRMGFADEDYFIIEYGYTELKESTMVKDLRDMIKDGMLINYRYGGVNNIDTVYLYKSYDAELKPEDLDESYDIMEVFEKTETGYESIWKREEEKFYWSLQIFKDEKRYLNYTFGQSIYLISLSKEGNNFFKTEFTQFEYDELVSNGIIKDVFTKEAVNENT